MKCCILIPLFLIVIGLIVIGLIVVSPGETILALGSTELEVLVLVTDAETGGPITGAKVEIWDDETIYGKGMKKTFMITDQEGKAKFVRKNVNCEDYIRPSRKTRTSYDLTWGSGRISAPGGYKREEISLHEFPYEVVQSFSDSTGERFTSLQFSIKLKKGS